LIPPQIFTNSDKAHAARVLEKLGLEDCFEGIICFETLNPSTQQDDNDQNQKNAGEADTDGSGSRAAGSDDEAPRRREILCKPSLESMEAVIEIAKLDAKRTVIDPAMKNY
jgi:putative hydrolase of the HAD superfamily/pyrimidine and pyridine-specific 5'-nucleotidase